MTWYEHGELTVVDRPNRYRTFVRTFRNHAAPGAEVRIRMGPVNTNALYDDNNPYEWTPDTLTTMGWWLYSLRPGARLIWSEEQTGITGGEYEDLAAAEGVARRILSGYKPGSINWDGQTSELPDLPWGRRG